MQENGTNTNENEQPKRKYNSGGGMYRGAKVPVKVLNWGIIIGIIALMLVTVFLISNGGFTVTFDANGGSHVESQRLNYGELIEKPQDPVLQGHTFDGWYWDIDFKLPWNFEENIVEGDMFLYAKWIKN